MAGTYTKKEFSAGMEEQNLLKNSNQPQIISKVSEPVKLSPGWEGSDRPEEELNFKELTMDQADLELNPPKDRLNLVWFIMLLHGIGALLPWNMFITAGDYFIKYKLSSDLSGDVGKHYGGQYLFAVTLASQIPNLAFNWINIFLPLGGDLTTRIVWGIFTQVLIFVITIILAMINTFSWPEGFFWVTMVLVFILNGSNGIFQNSVYGMAAKLPGKYTGAVILGSNISGTFVAILSILTRSATKNYRTAAIYYFMTALLVLLACFDTYFALPLNRFYRYHELILEKEKKKKLEARAASSKSTSYWTIFKQCSPQLFNIFFTFFVTLSLFPTLHSQIKQSDPDFFIPPEYYASIMCFLVFNVTAMLGSSISPMVQWPKKNWLVVPVVLRAFFIPLYLVCNNPAAGRTLPIYITNDWIYLVIAVAMGFSSGYLSSLGMMYCPTMVNLENAATAGMFAAATLITGIFSGLTFSYLLPIFVTLSIFK